MKKIALIIIFLFNLVLSASIKDDVQAKSAYMQALRYLNTAIMLKEELTYSESPPREQINIFLENLETAEKIFKQLIKYSDKNIYKLHLFKVYFHMGKERIYSSDAQALIKYLKQIEDNNLKGELYEYLGTMEKNFNSDDEKALFNFQKAFELYSETNYSIMYEIGNCYVNLKKYKLANKYFLEITDHGKAEEPIMDRSYYYLGDIAFLTRNDNLAISYFERVSDSYYLTYTEKLKVNSILAKNFLWKGEFENAADQNQRLYELTRKKEYLYELIENNFCAGKEINSLFDQINSQPDVSDDAKSLPEPLIIKAIKLITEQDYYKAYNIFRDLEQKDAGYFTPLFGILKIAIQLNSLSQVNEYYYKIALLYSLNLQNELAFEYIEKVDLNNSIEILDLYNIGLIYINANKKEKGEEVFNLYLKNKIYHEKTLVQIAFYFDNVKKYKESIKIYKILQSLFPGRFDYFYYAGLSYLYAENFINADLEMKKAIKISKDNPLITFQLGIISEKLKKFETAENYFYQTIKIMPTHALSHNYIGYLYVEKGIKLEKAKGLIETALKIEPDNPAFLDSMAWYYYKVSDYENADIYIHRALSQYSNQDKPDYLLYDHAGDIAFKLEKNIIAQKYWNLAIEQSDTDTSDIQKKIEKLNQ